MATNWTEGFSLYVGLQLEVMVTIGFSLYVGGGRLFPTWYGLHPITIVGGIPQRYAALKREKRGINC